MMNAEGFSFKRGEEPPTIDKDYEHKYSAVKVCGSRAKYKSAKKYSTYSMHSTLLKINFGGNAQPSNYIPFHFMLFLDSTTSYYPEMQPL